MKMRWVLMCALLSVVVAWAAVARSAQKVSPQMWEGNDADAGKGTRIPLPITILNAIKAKSRDCADAAQETADMFEAYSLETSGISLIAVKDGGRCGCSPTGNCSFGLYRKVGTRYDLILSSSMVQQFGFLTFKSHGFPDIVTRAHGSAFMSSARLWQFNGKRYVKRCSWDAVFRDGSEEAQIENNTCQDPSVKQSAPAEKP